MNVFPDRLESESGVGSDGGGVVVVDEQGELSVPGEPVSAGGADGLFGVTFSLVGGMCHHAAYLGVVSR